jgi:diguanylate cyclase (GGDEF)-like protein
MWVIKFGPSVRTYFTRPAVRDAVVIFALVATSMAAMRIVHLSRTFFAWVAVHPDSEIDAVILAGLLSTLGMLIYSVRRYRELQVEVTLRASAEERAFELAFRDPLTGLPNRRAFNERTAELRASDMPEESVALCLVDLDAFKSVNDAHGHLAGDTVLREIAARLSTLSGAENAIFRLGGDEFAILIRCAECVDTIAEAADAIIGLISAPIFAGGLVHHLGASVGTAIFPHDTADIDTLLRFADIAMYQAKARGRGNYAVFAPAMSDEILRRASIEQRLRESIGKGVIRPYFQPIVNLRSGEIIGFEMLSRWYGPDGQEITPDQFIPVAEETGLINDLFMEVLSETCRSSRHWPPDCWISINLSPVQFRDPWISEKILGCLAGNGFPPARLVIEITENALIANPESARQTVESLRNQGITFALDDFGTGHSSLHHLRVLPFDKLKIDRSYVQAIADDPEALNMVSGIISLAHNLGLRVVAEGIETPETAEQLRELGCEEGQGWYFGRPKPAAQIGHQDFWSRRRCAASGIPDRSNSVRTGT